MLCYQPDFFSPTEELTAERFTQLTISDEVVNSIKELRALRQKANNLQLLHDADTAQLALAKQLLQEADRLKRSLPKIVWQATFDVTLSKKGNPGRWRKQSAARLNGLYMVDVDHIADPKKTFEQFYHKEDQQDKGLFAELRRTFCQSLGILLVHITPSGHGLRLVAKADAARGNLSDNQHWLASQLNIEIDESCKDASRLSFCPMFDDILYINKEELFNYEDTTFDDAHGANYRGGSSSPLRTAAKNLGNTHPVSAGGTGLAGVGTTGATGHVGTRQGRQDDQLDARLKAGYHGKSYEEITTAWFNTVLHRVPEAGDRHQSLYRMACDLRYVTDHDPQLLARVLEECEVGRAICAERGTDEIQRIASDACGQSRFQNTPKRVLQVLEAAGVQLDAEGADDGAAPAPAIDYDAYWQRLRPLLSDSPGLREAVADLPDLHKLGGVLAAGAMLGTYLTRTWWEHYDGKLYRLSFLVYIVGAAASGKSFLTQMDRLLMAPLIAADRIGREAERQYKDKQKARKANEKLPDMPHPVVRYCPSTTSNAILYRRLQDAVDPDVIDPETGEPLHLHLITVESELATALRAQVGSWAGKNDLELKSFHNEKAGVDFANAESTNGIMQINWNQVISGTQESMSRKIKPATVLDGLVTRLALFLMPANDYTMIDRRRAVRNHERESMLRQLGNELECVKGELKVERLVDFCYQYEEELTRRARLEQDECLDYFRKRIPVIMMRYALVRLVLRQLEAAKKCEDLTVEDSDLEFARLIGDWCLEMQIYLFGDMVMTAREREKESFAPRKIKYMTRLKFNELPRRYSLADMVRMELAKNIRNARVTCFRWEKEGLVKRIDENTYQKCMMEI